MVKKVLVYSQIILIMTTVSCRLSNSENQGVENQLANPTLEIKPDTVALQDSLYRTGKSSDLRMSLENTYVQSKSEVEKIRKVLSSKYLSLTDSLHKMHLLDSANRVFTTCLLNVIVPHWYGTKWDFNGYTAIPREGSIACGYFVSTTLRDMGLKLNRYKLAQKGPEDEANSIAGDLQYVQHIDLWHDGGNRQAMLKELDEGLYFVGLDSHVGYLYIHDSSAYFIHSNYLDGRVMIENAAESQAFVSYNYFLTQITGNNTITNQWLMEIPILVK